MEELEEMTGVCKSREGSRVGVLYRCSYVYILKMYRLTPNVKSGVVEIRLFFYPSQVFLMNTRKKKR